MHCAALLAAAVRAQLLESLFLCIPKPIGTKALQAAIVHFCRRLSLGMVRKTRSRSCSSPDRKFPAAVSESERPGLGRQNSSPGGFGHQNIGEDSSSSLSSLDTSNDSGTVATPLLSPSLPRHVSATASLPARPTSQKKTGSSKKHTPASKQKAPKTPGSKRAKTPKTPGSASSSVRSLNPARTNLAGLPVEPDQRIVAQEIEHKGGVVAFFNSGRNPLHNLCEECSKNTEKGGAAIWGATKSERRANIKDKTRRWRELTPEGWKELCDNIGVAAADVLKT